MYPDAVVLSSPQCPPEIRQNADFVGSSHQLLRYVSEYRPQRLIVASDHGLAPHLRTRLPNGAELLLLPAEEACHCTRCPYMFLNTLPKLYHCLRQGEPEILIPEELAAQARQALERLLELAPEEELCRSPSLP